MKKKRPAPKAAKKWAYTFKKFKLPTFRSPLAEESSINFRDEIDHAFFLRCCELYLVLDLVDRSLDKLVDTYSKYRNRQQFTEALTFRYFDSEEALVAKFDPKLAAEMFFIFNLLFELRLSLTYTDDLPLTVKKEIDDQMWTLKEAWNRLIVEVQKKYGWGFKAFALPLESTSVF